MTISDADAVDAICDQWNDECPDLDTSAKEITGRIIRLAALFEAELDAAHAELGISGSDFGVLSPLRRAGEPYRLSPTEIANHRMITCGGLTPALDRLEKRGLIERVNNEQDRRSRLAQLTPAGRDVIDRAMVLHAAAEQRLVEGIDPATRSTLVDGLRRLLVSVESV